jgi:hypothetical protein
LNLVDAANLIERTMILAGRSLTWLDSRRLVYFLLALGAAIRLRAYLNCPSLWGDEAALALNFIERGYGELAQPLAHNQAAPLGFLWLVKTSVLAFGFNENSLRLVPFAMGLAGLGLFWLVAKWCFTAVGLAPRWVALALLLFVGSPPLINYSAGFKQYTTDVAITLLMLLASLRFDAAKASARQFVALGVLGAVLIWFSHPLILVQAGIGTVLMLSLLSLRPIAWRRVIGVVAIGCAWLASFAVEYVFLLREQAKNDYLVTYWVNGFLPWPVQVGTTLAWLKHIAHETLSYLTPDPLPWLSGPVLLAGIWLLARRGPKVCGLLVFPLLYGLLAAALHMFPYGQRLWLFSVPIEFLLIAAGAAFVVGAARLQHAAWAPLKMLLVLALLSSPAYGLWKFTVRPPDGLLFRTALEYYRDHDQPGDVLSKRGSPARATSGARNALNRNWPGWQVIPGYGC